MAIDRVPGWPGACRLPNAEGGHKRGGMVRLCPIEISSCHAFLTGDNVVHEHATFQSGATKISILPPPSDNIYVMYIVSI